MAKPTYDGHTTIIVEWTGPWEAEELCSDKSQCNGIYLAHGKQKYQRDGVFQYCGITKGTFAQRFAKHHKLQAVTRDAKFWFGKVVYPELFDRRHLELAETILVYAYGLPLNERKKATRPKPTTMINKWLKKDGTPRLRRLPLNSEFWDVISWDGQDWRVGDLKIVEHT